MSVKRSQPFVKLVISMSVFTSLAMPCFAQSVLTEKQISLPLAQEAAIAAIAQCRQNGYRVSVTVVDRAGQVKVMMRDDGAATHTMDASRRKAYTALTFRIGTAEFTKRVSSNPAAINLKDLNDVILLAGGLPIWVGKEVIGAIGVGGAPGGDKDEVCAQAGIDKISDRLK